MSQALYEFEKEEDYLAFTLKFSKKKPVINAGYFYCHTYHYRYTHRNKMRLKLINVFEYGLAPVDYFKWCEARNIPVMRVTLMKFRIREEDFVMFKLAFEKTSAIKVANDDEI